MARYKKNGAALTVQGTPEVGCLKTPTFKNAPRPILGQFNDRPVAMKLDQPAVIDGPQETGIATMHRSLPGRRQRYCE